jgi:hypothetical protein
MGWTFYVAWRYIAGEMSAKELSLEFLSPGGGTSKP